MKKLASNMSKSVIYSSGDIKISVSYGNTITNGDSNKQNVVRRIERVSLSDTRGKLTSVLPLALSKLRTAAETNGKSIVLFTDSPSFWKNVKEYDSFIEDLEKEGIKFIPTLFTKKSLGEADNESREEMSLLSAPKIHSQSPVVKLLTINSAQPEMPMVLMSPLTKVKQLDGGTHVF